MVLPRLSAVVGFQVFLYFQIFPKDTLSYKALVAWIWITDTAHTVAVCVTIWEYVGRNFTNPAKLQEIVPSYSATIVLTLIATLNVNLFYAWRIHKMSKHNWWLTGLICMLCLTRTALGLFTAAQTITLKDWATFNMNFKACKVAAWSISAATDVVISAARYYHLRRLKQGYSATREVVDVVVIFTINDGLLTCVTVIVVLACLLTMPTNFVWMGIFFSLAKLYSNSVLSALNLRNWYRHRHRPMGIPLTRHPASRNALQLSPPAAKTLHMQPSDMHEMHSTMEVFVDRQVEYTVPVGKYNEDNGDADCRGDDLSGRG